VGLSMDDLSRNTLCSPTGETVPAKVIHRQSHNSNLPEEREDDIP